MSQRMVLCYGVVLLLFSILTTSLSEDSCNGQTGPAGLTICQHDTDTGKLGWFSCVSNSYIKLKTKGMEQCTMGYDYCLYGCTSEEVQTHFCECSAPTEYTPADSAIPAWCFDPDGRNCIWYRECLDQKHPCEDADNGYALSYGEHFCSLYTSNVENSKFSQNAVEWIDDVRRCLQVALVPLIRPWQTVTCGDIKRVAFDSHAGCYTSPAQGAPSICSLGARDWLAIFWTIKGSFVSATAETLKEMVQVAGKCSWDYGSEMLSSASLKIRIIFDWFGGNGDEIAKEAGDKIALLHGWDDRTLIWFAYVPPGTDTTDGIDVIIMIADKLTLELTSAPDAPIVNLTMTTQHLVDSVREGELTELELNMGNVTISSSISMCVNPSCTDDGNSSQGLRMNPLNYFLSAITTLAVIMSRGTLV